jgi:mycothiol synthase
VARAGAARYTRRVEIAEVDLHGDERELRSWWEYLHRTYSVIVEPYEHLLNRERHVPGFFNVRHWAARDGDRVAGAAQARWYDTLDNRHRMDSRINLVPGDEASHAPLLDTIREHGRSLGKTTLGLEARTGSVEAGAAERAGARLCLREVHSVLPIGAVQRSRVDVPAPDGYELVRWTGACPDELVDDLVHMNSVMNTAPRGDMDMEDMVFTQDRQRAWEEAYDRRGWTRWTAAAREVATGRLVAYTELTIFDDHPMLIEQDNTAVEPAHRGRGLAKFVKAANVRRVLDERPGTGHIQTWNAETNAAMLAVNVGLGFVPVDRWEEWELPLSG